MIASIVVDTAENGPLKVFTKTGALVTNKVLRVMDKTSRKVGWRRDNDPFHFDLVLPTEGFSNLDLYDITALAKAPAPVGGSLKVGNKRSGEPEAVPPAKRSKKTPAWEELHAGPPPREFQREAVEECYDEHATDPRGQIIAACGAGNTRERGAKFAEHI